MKEVEGVTETRPVWAMLRAASGRVSGHMPGHKGQAPFGSVDLYALDTTELPQTDDLYSPEGALREAERRYAQAAGSAETLFLHNGSTAGNHVMVQLYARAGDTVLLPRNAHLSAVNGCVGLGLHVVWMPVTQGADGWCRVEEETVLRCLREHPETKAVLLTRPDYFGACLPLQRIAAAAHAQGTRVVVDEAHGAHLPWLDGIKSAGEEGADAWVQSVHKTLMGLTGSAVLHLAHAEDRPAAMRILRREQTSSPSFLLMLSIDDSRAWMELQGRARLRDVVRAADALRAALPAMGYRDAHARWRASGFALDPTRLVIDAPQGGHALAASLLREGVDVEMADDRRAVLILTAMDTPQTLAQIGRALRRIPALPTDLPALPNVTALPERAMEVRDAVLAETEMVPLAVAAGRVAAQAAGLYPPGVPLVAPGEIIPEETTIMLARAGSRRRFGTEGEGMLCVKR